MVEIIALFKVIYNGLIWILEGSCLFRYLSCYDYMHQKLINGWIYYCLVLFYVITIISYCRVGQDHFIIHTSTRSILQSKLWRSATSSRTCHSYIRWFNMQGSWHSKVPVPIFTTNRQHYTVLKKKKGTVAHSALDLPKGKTFRYNIS